MTTYHSKKTCNGAFINVISKVVVNIVFVSIVIVPFRDALCRLLLELSKALCYIMLGFHGVMKCR
jgi:hypothetical protein